MSTSKTGRIGIGTAAQRPAGGSATDVWIAIDTGIMSIYNGSSWKTVEFGSDVTMVTKQGSGGGSYTTASATLVDVDATNLSYTVTIPTGYKLHVVAAMDVFQLTGAVGMTFTLFDTQGSATIAVRTANPILGYSGGVTLTALVNGDGNSHTIKLRFATANVLDTAGIRNASGTTVGTSDIPTMSFILSPAS